MSSYVLDYWGDIERLMNKPEYKEKTLYSEPAMIDEKLGYVHRGGKYILEFAQKGQAEALINSIRRIRDEYGDRIGKWQPKLTALHAEGIITLTRDDAVRSQTKAASKVADDFRNAAVLQPKYADTFTEAASDIDKYIQEHGDRNVRVRVLTGRAYRITYFDPDKERRMQHNVGDVLAIYGKDIVFVSGRKTKKRSDAYGEEGIIVRIGRTAVYGMDK